MIWASVLLLSVLPVRIFLPPITETPSPAQTAAVSVYQTVTERISFSGSGTSDELPTIGHDAAAVEDTVRKTDILPVLSAGLLSLWAAGCLYSVLKLYRSYRSMCRSLNAYTVLEKDTHMSDLAAGICSTLGMKRIPLYRLHDTVTVSPCTVGILKPRIYYCGTLSMLDDASLSEVFLHECLHIRRHDLLFRLFSALILSVFWFYPLRSRIFSAICEDLEYGCDEAVLRRIGKTEREHYMASLLSVAISVSDYRKHPRTEALSPFTGLSVHLISVPVTKNTLKRRFLYMKAMDQSKRKHLPALFVTVFLLFTLILNTVLLSACGYPAGERTPYAAAYGDNDSAWCYDAFSVALQNHFGLMNAASVTDTQLAEITSVDVWYTENYYGTDGSLLAYISFNGGAVEQLLPCVIPENDYMALISRFLACAGCTEEDIAAYQADRYTLENLFKKYGVQAIATPEVPSLNIRTLLKFSAFYCEKSLTIPDLTEEGKAELLAIFPQVRNGGIYLFDPFTTQREEQYLYILGEEVGFFSETTMTEEAIRNSIGCYPALADIPVTFHNAGTWIFPDPGDRIPHIQE